MNRKMVMRLFALSALLILLLASCRGGETPPIPQMPTGTYSEARLPLLSPTPETPSPTPSLTATSTGTVMPTSNTAGFELKDWREPVEVITPENMNRVERIGQLESAISIWQFAFSPDGSWLGVSLGDTSTIIVDPFTFEKKFELSHSFGFVAFSYDGRILETGGVQFDLTTGKQISEGITFHPAPGTLMDVEFSPNGQYIVAAGTDHVEIHPMKSGIGWNVFGRDGEPWNASVSTDSKLIAVNYRWEIFTEIWNPFLMQPERILKMKDIPGKGKPRFSKDGKSLFFTGNGTWEGQKVIFFQEWDYLSGRPLHVQMIPGMNLESGLTMDISPVSQLAALGRMNGKTYLVPFRDCRAIQIGEKDQLEDSYDNSVDIVAFRPDGKLLATIKGSEDIIEFWGIPASGAGMETAGPMESETNTPVVCPKIPMIVEHPTPKYDWWRQ